MENFEYYAPTKVFFGKGTQKLAGKAVKEFKGKKVLLHYGGKSAIKSGLIDEVCQSLELEGIEYVTLGGVVPNPRLSLVRQGIELCKKENVDFILAVGGGSVIDSSKAIAYGIANDCDVWDFYSRKAKAKACAPVGAVLTIAAAGSEMSNSSVITNEQGWLKRGYSSDLSRPKFAIMNPVLTYTLPAYQTAAGCVDIMLHTLERYFTNTTDVELSDRLCESILKTIIHNAPIALKQPDNYAARAEIMWSSSLAHNNVTGVGRVQDWACHQLEHELSGMFDVAHGAGLASVWGSWARYVMKENPMRFAQLAVNVMGLEMDFENPSSTALRGIEAMEQFFKSIGMPIKISELGIDINERKIDELAHKCSFEGKRTIGGFKILNEQDMREIYTLAR